MPQKTYTQDELFLLSQKLGARLDDIIKQFDLDLTKMGKMWVGTCPIHGGDNSSAFNIYHTGIAGNWYCRTHQCEKTFKPTTIGLIRGLLSHQNGWTSLKDKNKITGFAETLDFIEKFLGNEIIKIDKVESEKRRFSQTFKLHERNGHTKFSRSYIRMKLKIPANYYLDRGYTKEILDKYDVGLCDDPTKPFYNRVVIPVYDDDYSCIVGYTARSIFKCCTNCGCYHDNSINCPKQENKWKSAKWLNNKDFHREDYLFNYWFAKKEIERTGIIIFTESPGNVLRLVESGINNVVGIFGTTLTDSQKFIVDCSGAHAIFYVGDNDEAGEKSVKEITEKCRKLYYVDNFKWKESSLNNYGDIGDVPTDLVTKELKPIIDKFIEKNVF